MLLACIAVVLFLLFPQYQSREVCHASQMGGDRAGKVLPDEWQVVV